MITTFITAIGSFISTNIDDIFILMIFFTWVNKYFKVRHIIVGQFLGIGLLIVVSVVAAQGMLFLPGKYISLLGIVPIYLGIKEWINSKKEEEDEKIESRNLGIIGVSAITIANGADNLGIYIPLFSSMNKASLLITIIIFLVLTGVWCLLGLKLSEKSFIEGKLKRYKNIIVPIVFICIGVFILFGI